MPHMTWNHMFEMKATGMAGRILDIFATGEYRSFLLELTADGKVSSLSFENIGARLDELRALGHSYILYDPLEDGMEYVYMEWHSVSRETMERLCGHKFEEVDFNSMGHSRGATLNPPNQFPETWSVMF